MMLPYDIFSGANRKNVRNGSQNPLTPPYPSTEIRFNMKVKKYVKIEIERAALFDSSLANGKCSCTYRHSVAFSKDLQR